MRAVEHLPKFEPIHNCFNKYDKAEKKTKGHK